MLRTFVRDRLKLLVVLGVLIHVVSGCGPSGPEIPDLYPVSGSVTFEGKPVPGAQVIFIPAKEDPKKPPSVRAAGETDDQGNFALMWGDNDGAPEGSYKVIIIAFKERGPDEDTESKPASLIPDKYGSPASSGLTAIVKEDGDNTANFAL